MTEEPTNESVRATIAHAQPGQGLRYRDTGSPLHRLGAGCKLALSGAAATLAIASDSVVVLFLLLGALLVGYRLAGLRAAELWQDARWLLVQAGVIVALSAGLHGPGTIPDALRTALTIGLVFLPGALVLRTTSSTGLVSMLERWLPDRLAFAAGASVRFVPLFVREAHEIVAAQRLRGARLSARELWRPGAWRDWAECVGVPLAIRVIRIADQAALAAEIRGLGRREEER
jgi:energy-coupling factor transporter transmembrane protein EcfT